MRPKLLEMEGFTSFREKVQISFEEVSLFSLSGPTGAGKSSVIDALTFALYGSVPRYDNRNLVAPAISQGLEEMKVRLDFQVEDNTYTAVRVVRRTRSGATTAEARLESKGKVLAGNAEELTTQVTSLLGLSFEHFIKCAVLPQGAFARFLHEPAGKRQDLLVELLELQVYQQISQLAKSRQSRLEDETRAAEKLLDKFYRETSSEALKLLRGRLDELSALTNSIRARQQPVAKLEDKIRELEGDLKATQQQLTALQTVQIPANLEDLTRSLEGHRGSLQEISGLLGGQRKVVAESRKKLEGFPESSQLEAAIFAEGQLQKTAQRIEQLSPERNREKLAKQGLESELSQLENDRKRLDERRGNLLNRHLALQLTRTLEAGERCPVCDQIVSQVPDRQPPPELAEVESQLEEVRQRRENFRRQEQQSVSRIARLQVQLENLHQQRSRKEKEASGLPTASEAANRLKKRKELEISVADCAIQIRELEQRQEAFQKKILDLQESEQKARTEYHRLMGRLEKWKPPEIDPEGDLLSSWQDLCRWQKQHCMEVERKQEQWTQELARVCAQRVNLESEIRESCLQLEIDLRSHDPMTACSLALAEVQTRHSQMEAALAQARLLKQEVKEKRSDAETARELANLLNARNFERWYLNRALQRLVQGASIILRQLTRDQYSLAVDEKSNFEVVDHTNAHHRRLAKTLSGGETFLASLALALALSEHVAELSVRGTAPLEALFLDEGFGTLDNETLDVVACALEELGARGRMVGIVTHVQEFARRMPVRFEISKTGGNSRIERIDH